MLATIADASPGLIRRFMAKVDEQPCGCWYWTGACNSKGYPVFRTNGALDYAHRVAHKLFIGPIPDGEQIHHLCCDQKCVNPAHLKAVTPELNRHMQTLGIGELPADFEGPDVSDTIPV